ncbi:MAG: right-handed parallel beta-helix repeat-containing protein, partial [Thermoanaerobaculia bacterium]
MGNLRAAAIRTILLASVVSTPLLAVDFVVTRYDDPDPNSCDPADCSLREAALDADATAGPDRILLSAGKYILTRFTGDDDGLLGDLDIHDEVEIVGAGATMTTIDAAPIGNAAEDSVMSIFATTVLRDLKIIGSQVDGIRIFGADVTIERCDITNNSFQGTGAGVKATGGETLVIRDSSIINNGNGIVAVDGTVEMENVTLHSNNATQISVSGGALLFCTHCTLVDTVGGNPEVRVDASIAFFANSIIHGVCNELVGGIISTQGGNVESPGHSCAFTLPNDRQDQTTAGLSAIGDHGGDTRTFDLLSGSPALSLVADADCLPHDQRNVARSPQPFAPCDAGAVERTTS